MKNGPRNRIPELVVTPRPAFAPAWCFAFAFCLAGLHRIGRITLFLFSDPEHSADPLS